MDSPKTIKQIVKNLFLDVEAFIHKRWRIKNNSLRNEN